MHVTVIIPQILLEFRLIMVLEKTVRKNLTFASQGVSENPTVVSAASGTGHPGVIEEN